MATATTLAPPQSRAAPPARRRSDFTSPEALGVSRSLRLLWSSSETPTDRVRNLFRLLASKHDVVAVTLFDRGANTEYRPTAPLMCLPQYAQTARGWETALLRGVLVERTPSEIKLFPLPGSSEEFVGLVVPVVSGGEVLSLVCLVVRSETAAESCLLLTAQLAAAELAVARQADASSNPSDDGSSDALVQTVLQATSNGGLTRGYEELALRLRDELRCHSVILGVCTRQRGRCVLQAISGIPTVRRHSPLATRAEGVLNEAIVRNTVQFYDAEHPTSTTTDTEKELAQLCQTRGVLSGPIYDATDKAVGGWVILLDAQPQAGTTADWLARVQREAAELPTRLWPCIEMLRRSRPSWPIRVLDGLIGPQIRRARLLAPIMVALVCLLILPYPYRVKCDSVLQPVTRRFVPMPYDGVLDEVLVQPGDVVRANQVLARLDGREIQWELVARQSEYGRSQKQFDVQLAGHNTAAAQIAKLEMDRLDLQIKLLQHKAANLEIRSPIDGVVIGGDPQKKERARLRMGEGLFEVGPPEEMLGELLIPDEEVGQVQPGQPVRIRLDAFSDSPLQGIIQRVSPQAELRGQKNVFVAEVLLANPAGSLRPGMMGRGRVTTAKRSLFWILFHKPWDRLIRLVAW